MRCECKREMHPVGHEQTPNDGIYVLHYCDYCNRIVYKEVDKIEEKVEQS